MLEIQELLVEIAIGSERSFKVTYMFFPFRCLTRFTGSVPPGDCFGVVFGVVGCRLGSLGRLRVLLSRFLWQLF